MSAGLLCQKAYLAGRCHRIFDLEKICRTGQPATYARPGSGAALIWRNLQRLDFITAESLAGFCPRRAERAGRSS